ncbi:MAG: LPS export ABC transporter periplasmic protein LptC [Pseudomonadota bacterium]
MNTKRDSGQIVGDGNLAAAASAPSSPSNLEFISGQRSDHEFDEAIRHRKRVKFLKFAMPVVGILILLAIIATLIIRQFFVTDIDLGAIAVQDGKLVMENPNLNGFDKNRRPFSLSAERAVQDADQPKRVELIRISANLPMDDTVSAEVRAGNGVYDAEERTLVLTEQVHVRTTDGMKIDLEDADVDLAEGTLKTDNPIFASSPQADISAGSLLVEEGGDRLIFEGAVRMTLRPKALKEAEAIDG